MAVMASAVGSILSSGYNLYNNPAEDKQEAVEGLLLGILKATAAFSIYLALYVAETRLESWELKAVALGCAFCVSPLAAVDFQLILGVCEVYTSFAMHVKNRKEIKKIYDKVIEQAKAEGYRFYSYLERRFLYGTRCPPETEKRCRELSEIAGKNPEVKLVVERVTPLIVQSEELVKQGSKRLAISGVAEIALANLTTRLPQLFWLDRKMGDFSKWIASHISL